MGSGTKPSKKSLILAKESEEIRPSEIVKCIKPKRGCLLVKRLSLNMGKPDSKIILGDKALNEVFSFQRAEVIAVGLGVEDYVVGDEVYFSLSGTIVPPNFPWYDKKKDDEYALVTASLVAYSFEGPLSYKERGK